MRISEVKKIGKKSYTFTGEGENLFQAITELGNASFGDVEKCGICGSDKLILEAHKTKEENYEYCSIRCQDCKSSLTLGKTKKGNNFFLRRDESGKYDWQKAKPIEKK